MLQSSPYATDSLSPARKAINEFEIDFKFDLHFFGVVV
jgi:hypothetical protein